MKVNGFRGFLFILFFVPFLLTNQDVFSEMPRGEPLNPEDFEKFCITFIPQEVSTDIRLEAKEIPACHADLVNQIIGKNIPANFDPTRLNIQPIPLKDFLKFKNQTTFRYQGEDWTQIERGIEYEILIQEGKDIEWTPLSDISREPSREEEREYATLDCKNVVEALGKLERITSGVDDLHDTNNQLELLLRNYLDDIKAALINMRDMLCRIKSEPY